MRILLFTLEYPPFKGGVSNYYENLIKYWPKTIGATTITNKPDEIFVLNNNENKLLKKWIWPRWIFLPFVLLKEIVKNRIDHIIVGHILPLGTVTYFITRILRKIDYTVILHGMDFEYALKRNRKKKMARKILIKAKNIICVNSYTAGLVKNFLAEESRNKIHIVNPGIKQNINIDNKVLNGIKEDYRLGNKLVLFSVGRLVKRKGFDKVIEAMPEIVKSVPNLYYFIAGDGPDKIYLKELAKGVNNIIFLGEISEEAKWAWLKLSDIFITVSRNIDGDFEGFGIVYLEAGLLGKPVIAGDSGGVRDAVQGAYSGILVDPENVNRIANAVIGLAQDAKLRVQLGEQGRQRVLQEFSWEKKINQVYDIVHNKQ